MFWAALLACVNGPAPAPPVRPTLGVAMPLSNGNAVLGENALQGVTLAAGDLVDIVTVDDSNPGAVAELAAMPHVFGAVGHVTRRAAEATAAEWRASDLPVVISAPGTFEGLPRVTPPPAMGSARCATLFLDTNFWVRTDGSPEGMAAGKALLDAAPDHALGMETVDLAHAASQAAKMGGRSSTVVWTGDAGAGGNYVRALRQTGVNVPFFGVGTYDHDYLQAAGAAAEGTRATSQGRPARNRAFVDAFAARYGYEPSGVAVDAYEAATLLIAAWQAAGGPGAPPTRAAVRAALGTVVAEGANGPMQLDADGVLAPVVCAVFTVKNGAFAVDRIASETDEPPEPPAPPRRPRRKAGR